MENKLTKYILIFIILGLVTYITLKKHYEYKQDVYNSVELKTEFKTFIVIEKYSRNNRYYLKLYNQLTENSKVVEVTQNIYYNVYFVGDTIK